MNDMYYEDYLSSSYPYEQYSMSNSQNQRCNECYRNESSSIDSYSQLSSSRLDSFFNPLEGYSKGNMQANIYKPYKLTNPNLPPVYNDKERMLLEVQKYGFAMWDLNLYLNTHPTDRNVMMLFDQYRNMYNKAKQDYENKYGPLCLESTPTNSGYWPWNKCPWPWEGE